MILAAEEKRTQLAAGGGGRAVGGAADACGVRSAIKRAGCIIARK